MAQAGLEKKWESLPEKQIKAKWALGMALVVECLISNCQALIQTSKKKKGALAKQLAVILEK